MRFRKVGTRRAQAISKVVMAVAWQGDGDVARRARRARLRGGDPDPGRGHGRLPWRAASRHPRRPTGRPRPWPPSWHPIDDVRSTAEYRRLVAARVLHRIVRDAGGW